MSDIYITRQPIFDKKMQLYGYELLYRKYEKSIFSEADDDRATASLLDDFLLSDFLSLIDETRGILSFSEKLLVNQIPLMLPNDNLIIQISADMDINDALAASCRDLKRKGYIFVLNDFVLSDINKYSATLDLVDIIKIQFSEEKYYEHKNLITKYKGKIIFLAEKVETADHYKQAANIGFSLFQGYFFSKPVMINSKSIGSLTNNLVVILNELNKPEPRYKVIALEFEKDVDLSYKLLRLVNSAYYGATHRIDSIRQGIVHLGTQELLRWVHLLLLKGIQNTENAELVKVSLIRGKFLSLLSIKMGKAAHEADYFITGLFSSIDMLLNEDMAVILKRLPLSDMAADALLAKPTKLRIALETVLYLERGKWENVDNNIELIGITKETFMEIYKEAIKWQHSL